MEQKLAVLQAKIEADQSLAEKLFVMETPEEVQSLLKAEGMDFTPEEINMLRDALLKALAKGENGELSTEELSDDELNCIAGGWGLLCPPVHDQASLDLYRRLYDVTGSTTPWKK